VNKLLLLKIRIDFNLKKGGCIAKMKGINESINE